MEDNPVCHNAQRLFPDLIETLTKPNRRAEATLVFRGRPIDMIDHELLDRKPSALQPEAQLCQGFSNRVPGWFGGCW